MLWIALSYHQIPACRCTGKWCDICLRHRRNKTGSRLKGRQAPHPRGPPCRHNGQGGRLCRPTVCPHKTGRVPPRCRSGPRHLWGRLGSALRSPSGAQRPLLRKYPESEKAWQSTRQRLRAVIPIIPPGQGQDERAKGRPGLDFGWVRLDARHRTPGRKEAAT